ncbi:MAG: ABC transporter permease [Gemmatimonadota bacterium]|nr:MAG: ABC transporter permease [Gemmatimonadota bacterium]
MRKVLRIAKREYLATVRTKGFILGLVLAPVLFAGSALAMLLFRNQVDTRDKVIAVIDRSGLVAEAVIAAAESRNSAVVYDTLTGEKIRAPYVIELVPPEDVDPDRQRLELSNRVRRGELHAFVEIGAGALHPREEEAAARIGYYSKSSAVDDLRSWIERPINGQLRRLRLAEAGVDPAAAEDMFDWVGAAPMGLVSVDPETGAIVEAKRSTELEAILAPLVMPMLMFLMIMLGAVPLLNAVMEEKSQRIAEVVLGSVKPFEFMSGKVLGGVGVSLTAATVYVVGGVFAVRHMGWADYIPYQVLPWFFAYTLLAIIMLGATYAAFGSVCNDPSEAQSLMLPGMLPVMIPMFVLVPVLREPTSAFATGLSFVPFFTPMLMLIRQTVQDSIPVWQPWLGIAGMILFAAFCVWGGGRVFRVAILTQGTPPKFGNIVRWALRG